MPGLRKGRCQRSWRAARQQERRMAFLTKELPGVQEKGCKKEQCFKRVVERAENDYNIPKGFD